MYCVRDGANIDWCIVIQRLEWFSAYLVSDLSIAAHENVWKEILDMQDHISVKYEALEQLFCQKQIQKAKENEKKKAKPPSEVKTMNSTVYHNHKSLYK